MFENHGRCRLTLDESIHVWKKLASNLEMKFKFKTNFKKCRPSMCAGDM